MKVALTTHGRFHSFDLARQLEKRDVFAGIWTPFPAFKVANERLPQGAVHSIAGLTYVRQVLNRVPGVPHGVFDRLEWVKSRHLDRVAARQIPADADALVGLSGGGLAAPKAVQSRGGVYVCDRGSTHCRFQEATMREECARYGAPYRPSYEPALEIEEAQYAMADAILVPTGYVAQTFYDRGFAPEKVKKAPYGVDLTQFYPDGAPPEDAFEVLFVGQLGIRKGIKYLLEAFERFDHPRKRLTLVGPPQAETADLVAKAVATGHVVATGSLPRDGVRERMSRSHVMVLPSVEEGLALVQAQALACGCPVVAVPPTGCDDLFTDGVEGFIVPSRDPGAIADRLAELADRPELRAALSAAAVERVKDLGGWDRYGDLVFGHLEAALASRR